MATTQGRDHPGTGVPVRYLGGCQRSGSTLLARMLGAGTAHVSVGEVVHLWARGVRDDEPCGCGEAFSACPFWTEVGRLAFGGWDRLDQDHVLALQRRVDRTRFIPSMLAPGLRPGYRRDLVAYVGVLDALYRAMYEAAEGRVVVDASKHASTAFLLRRVPSVRLRVTHLVRDARGVAFSLAKRVVRPEAAADGGRPAAAHDRAGSERTETLMYRAPAWRSALEWVLYNLLFAGLRLTGTPSRTVRYEDLLATPHATLTRIVADDGGAPEAIAGVATGEDEVVLGIDHTVAGNPMRLRKGPEPLRVDDAWRREMPGRARRTVEVLAWPMLLAYGYLGGRGSGRDPGRRSS